MNVDQIKNREEHYKLKHFNRNMMNLLLNMDLKNLLTNLTEANNKIIHLFLWLKPEAIHKTNCNQ